MGANSSRQVEGIARDVRERVTAHAWARSDRTDSGSNLTIKKANKRPLANALIKW